MINLTQSQTSSLPNRLNHLRNPQKLTPAFGPQTRRGLQVAGQFRRSYVVYVHVHCIHHGHTRIAIILIIFIYYDPTTRIERGSLRSLLALDSCQSATGLDSDRSSDLGEPRSSLWVTNLVVVLYASLFAIGL